METFEELFNNFINKKTKKQIKKIDKLNKKLGVSPGEFWAYFKRNFDYFAGVDFLDSILTYFYYFLSEKIDRLFEDLNITFKDFYFDVSEDGIYILNNEEFDEVISELDLDTKEKLIEDKIFAFFMKKTKTEIFNKKEKRAIKIKSLQND